MSEILLADATTQEIQLELIRRRLFNEFDGRKVAASLLRHKDLWLSVMMMNPPYAVGDGEMSFLCLQPLVAMLRNSWQADTLFVLCESLADVERLLEVARADEWGFDADDIVAGDVLSKAVGIRPFKAFALKLWWD